MSNLSLVTDNNTPIRGVVIIDAKEVRTLYIRGLLGLHHSLTISWLKYRRARVENKMLATLDL